MKKLLSLPLLCVILSATAQNQNQKVVPPSPEATSVFKFSEVPVSPYSGLANTGIPLYEIKLKDMTIPVNLNYHGRGVRVEEIASRVGLGWSLNYGGMLSCQIRGGVADEPENGPLNQYTDLLTNPPAQHNRWLNILNGARVDEAPDKFMLDMNGQSVNFMFDFVCGGFRLQKYADINISMIAGTETEGFGVVGWIITDQHGNKFYYGKNKNQDRVAIDRDITTNSYSVAFTGGQITTYQHSDDPPPSKNTWHLMEIETVNHEKVEFFYEEELLYHFNRLYDRKGRVSTDPVVRCYYTKIESEQYQVKKITFNGGQVTFGKSPLMRQDVLGYDANNTPLDSDPRTLDTVSVYDNNNSLLKRYQLGYQYTTASGTSIQNQNHVFAQLEPQSEKRLFLTTIQEKGKNAETLPPTTLEYSTVLLPNRFSNAQDAWGYYNGKPNGEYLTFFNETGITPNRNIDTVLSEAGLLKKMTYPSGGNVAFTYEQNIGKSPSYMSQVLSATSGGGTQDIMLAGGRRIKKVEYKNANGTALIKTYKYQNTDGSTSGQVLGLPCSFYLIPVGESTLYGYTENPGLYPMFDEGGVTPGLPLSNVQGNGIGYSYVEEYTGDQTTNLGKTAYTYTNMEDAGNYWKFPYEYPVDNEWLRGSNLSTSVYKNVSGTYVLQKQITNTYKYGNTTSSGTLMRPFLHADSIYTTLIDRTKWYMPLIKIYESGVGSDHQAFIYYQIGGTLDPANTTETDYETGSTQLAKTTTYYYDYPKHYLTSATETSNSDGSTSITHVSYPASYPPGTDFIDNLTTQHILDVPIEQVTYKNKANVNTILSGTLTLYKTSGSAIIDQVLKLETLQPIALSSFKFSDRLIGVLPLNGTAATYNADARYQPNMQFNNYDSQNNPLMLTQPGGQPVSYVWGYNQRYPVAKLLNATYQDIVNVLGQTNIDLLVGANPGTDTQVRSILAVLRTDARLKDAQVTTYTYASLTGMTSQTDAKGQTTYYEYDGFQRLMNIKDKDGNIIKHVEYNYQH